MKMPPHRMSVLVHGIKDGLISFFANRPPLFGEKWDVTSLESFPTPSSGIPCSQVGWSFRVPTLWPCRWWQKMGSGLHPGTMSPTTDTPRSGRPCSPQRTLRSCRPCTWSGGEFLGRCVSGISCMGHAAPLAELLDVNFSASEVLSVS